MISFERMAAAVLLVVLAACAAPVLPPAPGTAVVPVKEYVVGPGDVLKVTVWRHGDLSGDVPVRSDGKITLPLIADVEVVGKTAPAVAEEVRTALRRYVQEPTVTVQVQQSSSQAQDQVRVVGQVIRPSAVPYKPKMTVLDALLAVGGFTPFASGNRAVLIRSSGDGKQYSLRLHDLLKNGDITANVELLPGDVVMVPESWF